MWYFCAPVLVAVILMFHKNWWKIYLTDSLQRCQAFNKANYHLIISQSVVAVFLYWVTKLESGNNQGPVVQSVVSLTSSLRVISLTILADSIYNILIFFAEKMRVAFTLHCKSYSHFFSKKFQHICISLDLNFNESLINDIVSFEQLGPGVKSNI